MVEGEGEARVLPVPFWRKNSVKTEEIEQKEALAALLIAAKSGDVMARETILVQFQPLLFRTLMNLCRRPITESEDEYAIALIAFNDAIDRYQADKGSFVGFATLLIKRRVIDEFRSNQRHQEIPYATFAFEDEEGQTSNTVENKVSVDRYWEEQKAKAIREEIVEYTGRLRDFGISMDQLIEVSPSHQDAREAAIGVAKILIDDPFMREHLLRDKTIPLKQLVSQITVSKKTVERHRKYIIAVALLMLGDYHYLQDFVQERGLS